MSAATIDRMLSGARASAGGRRSRAKTTPAVRRRVPVRTFADWHEPAPGFVEADLVVHCGESMAGQLRLDARPHGHRQRLDGMHRVARAREQLDRRRARSTAR